MASLAWTAERVSELIDLYENHPCLYNTKRKDYSNRNARSEAIEAIASTLHVTEDEVLKKIKNVRTVYMRERKKMENSRMGSGTEVYRSKWSYTQRLRFLDAFAAPKRTRFNLLNDTAFSAVAEDSTEVLDRYNSQPAERPAKATKQRSAKRRKGLQEEVLLEKVLSVMEKNGESSERKMDADAIFAQYIASELRCIEDPHIKRVTKWKIQSIIFSAHSTGFSGACQASIVPGTSCPTDPLTVTPQQRPGPDPGHHSIPSPPLPGQSNEDD